MTYKLGSLFDGSGGFPLAGSLCGIEPVLASEVEPYPVAVTRSRFPNMKHYGDVSKINGAEVEPVDIITFGSPCQDMSVAGKRAGLKHEANGDEETTRSGLFMEAVRIIKEMREATNGEYPTFALWENVPGAFSSNKGEDFRIVCEELIKIVEPAATMPGVPKNGWAYADSYIGNGWSLAYRVFDAQYWGVPQRRRRIYLVLDLRGERAGKILFEREGLRGYFAQSGAQRETAAGDAEGGVGADDRAGVAFGVTAKGNGDCFISEERHTALSTGGGQAGQGYPCAMVPNLLLDDQGGSQISIRTDGKSPTLRAEMHGNVPCVLDVEGLDGYNSTTTGDKSSTLGVNCGMSTGRNGVIIAVPTSTKEQHLFENHSQDTRYKGPLDVCPMLPAQLGTGGNNQPFVVEETIPIHDKATRYKGGGPTRNGDGAGNGFGVGKDGDPSPTLSTCDRHIVAYSIGNGQLNQISMSETCNTLDCMHDKQAVLVEDNPIVLDRAFYNQGQNALYDPQFYTDGTVPTLVARGPAAVAVRYIVRRLTPTECARLQGFPDFWGHPDHKESFTDEEAEFWRGVHLTDCAINGKKPKPKIAEKRTGWESATCDWYNKLHTDSAEYKMWGNGIALPCALYVLQGIADALKGQI